MKFEFSITIGDKAFGGHIIIKDFDKAPNKEVAENALKRAMENVYNKAVQDAVEEAMNG